MILCLKQKSTDCLVHMATKTLWMTQIHGFQPLWLIHDGGRAFATFSIMFFHCFPELIHCHLLTLQSSQVKTLKVAL